MKSKIIDFKKELNPSQYQAVTAEGGTHLVLAGAGSGKTRTLVYRVAWLIEQGLAPEKILLLTFTNKAANEMMSRVRKLLGYRDNQKLPIWGGTFHALANRLLRTYGSKIGLERNFTIMDSDDSEKLINTISQDFFGSQKEKSRPSPAAIQEIISFAANAQISLAESLDRKFGEWSDFLETIEKIAVEYQRRKRLSKVLDFDDLLGYWLELTKSQDLSGRGSKLWEHILVDEYQDTNRVQAEIIRRLSQEVKNIMVVGDDSQSIYSFRAADIDNILSFPKQFKNCQIHKLETNYRSTPEILQVANAIIQDAPKEFAKNLQAVKESGLQPNLVALSSQKEEAWFVAERIQTLLDQGLSPREIAVLFRAASHSQHLEMELNRRGISYEMRGGLKFFARAHIKDVLSFIKILGNWRDEIAWLRVLQMYEGIGPITARQIHQRILDLDKLADLLTTPLTLAEKAGQSWFKITATLAKLIRPGDKSVGQLINIVLEDYADYLAEHYADYRQRQDDLEQLILFAQDYQSLELFLNEISLQESFGLRENKNDETLVLSTVHQAKGLEWEAVFVINLTDQSFPHPLCVSEAEQAEEKRLFYVAVTRAGRYLYLCYPLSRASFRYESQGSYQPSPFVSELDLSLFLPNDLARSTLYRKDSDLEYVLEEGSNESGYLPDPGDW